MLKSVSYTRELTYLSYGIGFNLILYIVITMFVDFLRSQYAIEKEN